MFGRIPLLSAALFLLVDTLWVVALHVYSASANYQSMVQAWYYVHAPIRSVVDAKLYPALNEMQNAHFAMNAAMAVPLYQGICVLQSLLLGYVLGLLIQMFRPAEAR